MRKTAFALILVLCAITVYAQTYGKEEVVSGSKNSTGYIGDFELGGEIKTGVLWKKSEDQLNNPIEETVTNSKDDAGSGPARFRFNFGYFHQNLNIGIKFRINWERWNTSSENVPQWHYAFGYVKFLDDQLTMSIGKLGASPWGTGGPEMWQELESIGSAAGIRLEVEPNAVPGLNAGLVLNGFNGTGECWGSDPVPMYEYLMESVLGASYTHEWFHARAALRLDSQCDGTSRDNDGIEGVNIIYRFEEYALQKLVPGLSFWAMGYIYGIGASENNQSLMDYRNWMFVEYAPILFTTQLRVGVDTKKNINTLYVKPSFYLTPFDKIVKVGASFEYTRHFWAVESDYKDSWFHVMEIRPLLQYQINPNSYVALEYSYRREYKNYYGTLYETNGLEPVIQNQWINLRVGISF